MQNLGQKFIEENIYQLQYVVSQRMGKKVGRLG